MAKKENRIESTQEAIERLEKENSKLAVLKYELNETKNKYKGRDLSKYAVGIELPSLEMLQGFIEAIEKRKTFISSKLDELCQES